MQKHGQAVVIPTMRKERPGMGRLSSKVAIALLSMLLLGALVFSMATPALAVEPVTPNSAPQEFYLTDVNHPEAGKSMDRSSTVRCHAGDLITIAAGGSQLWLANEAAQVDVTFPFGEWVLQFKTDTWWGDAPLFPDPPMLEGTSVKCRVVVGEWDINAHQFNSFSTTTDYKMNFDDGKYVITAEFQANPETVYDDNYLALQIWNDDDSEHTIYTDGESSLKSPDSDPGYPVSEPEAVSIVPVSAVILGAGLFVLMVLVTAKRVKKSGAEAL